MRIEIVYRSGNSTVKLLSDESVTTISDAIVYAGRYFSDDNNVVFISLEDSKGNEICTWDRR